MRWPIWYISHCSSIKSASERHLREILVLSGTALLTMWRATRREPHIPSGRGGRPPVKTLFLCVCSLTPLAWEATIVTVALDMYTYFKVVFFLFILRCLTGICCLQYHLTIYLQNSVLLHWNIIWWLSAKQRTVPRAHLGVLRHSVWRVIRLPGPSLCKNPIHSSDFCTLPNHHRSYFHKSISRSCQQNPTSPFLTIFSQSNAHISSKFTLSTFSIKLPLPKFLSR